MDGEAFISHWRLAVGHRVQASKPPHPNAAVVKIGRKWVHVRMVESHRMRKFAIEDAGGFYPTVPGLPWPLDRRR